MLKNGEYKKNLGIYKSMKKFKFKNLISIFLGCACIVICILFSFIKISEKSLTSKVGYKAVITIWQIDTFDGGTGSRTAFLRNITNEYHKKHQEVLFLVINHTVESANAAFLKNKIPDIISYGNCNLEIIKFAREICDTKENDGGVINGKRYAMPWLKGCYYYITHANQKIEEVKNSFVVDNENYSGALPLLAQNLKVANPIFLNSKESLIRFKADKNSALIGTQRDIVRLQNQEISFNAEPLTEFCDLYQYASITTMSDEKVSFAISFLNYLTSFEVQKNKKFKNVFDNKRCQLR